MSEQTRQCAYRAIGYDGSLLAYIGEPKKDKRVCRFCGRSMPYVKFNKKAHALSEAIGNKLIINNEECDSCNENFSVIEQDFFNRHAALLSIYNVKGKNGSRKLKTETVDIFDQFGIITLEPHNLTATSIKYDSNGIGSLELSLVMKYNPHRPQNIYKCLVKYALSVMETSYVDKFKETIKWITNGKLYIKHLPKVILYSTRYHNHPRIAVFMRNEDYNLFPYAFSIVEFADVGYCFILPLGNDEPITGYMEQNLVGAFLQFSNRTSFNLVDLSNTNKIVNKQTFTIGNLDKRTEIFLQNPITPELVQELRQKQLIL